MQKESSSEVTTFDARKAILSKKKKEWVEKIYSEFIGPLVEELADFVSMPVNVEQTSIRISSYEDYRQSIQGSFLFNLFDIDPHETSGLLRLDNNLVLIAIDRILGGSAEGIENKEALSLIELKMSEAFLNKILNRLNSAWETYGECNFRSGETASTLEKLKFLAPDDSILVSSFDIKLGEFQGQMDVAFPDSFSGPILAAMDNQEKQSFGNLNDPKIVHILKEKMRDVVVPISVYLGEQKLSLKELLELEPGHVIQLGSLNNDLDIRAGKLPLFAGQPGIKNNNLAVKIVTDIQTV